MNDAKIIDTLIDADEKLINGWGELKATGQNDTYKHLSLFMGIDSQPTILTIFKVVKNSVGMSINDKWHALEGVSCGLGEVAFRLGYIDKYSVRVKIPPKDFTITPTNEPISQINKSSGNFT